MKYKKYIFLVSVLTFLGCNEMHAFSDKSFMTYRSQGFNLARDNAGWLKRCTEDNASIAVEYSQLFNGQAVSNYFFGAKELIFSGSRVENRGSNDILADYFGLPTNFRSCVTFSPEIKNFIIDFDFYWLLGCDFTLRINSPLVYSKWGLNPCEKVIDSGSFAYPAGYMSSEIIESANLSKGALETLSGKTKFGDLTFPLQYGRISGCSQSLTKLSDIIIALGYNLICKPSGMCALDLHVVVPTGTRSKSLYLFEPQIGNGHHWALGGSIAARYDFIGDEECDINLSAHLDAYVQHLFKSSQKRSYDLCSNGSGSRYMLLMDMISNFSINEGFSATPFIDLINRQYATRLLYVADATTLDSKIRINAQADVVAKLSASYCHWNCEIGYNLWARTAETLVCRAPLQHNFYGVKGDAQVYGYLPIGVDLPLPLNATQSKATVRAPQPNGNTTNNFINSNADNPALLFNVGLPIAQSSAASSLIDTGVTSIEQVNGSNQAITLSDSDINNCSGLSPRAISHKIFGSVRYEFETCRTQPYLLLGGEAEFAGKVDCVKSAISQWGVWLKTGINY